ncbi:NAD-dependent epimerase/dehydratase family protein [Candidatus Parcubacteria bacterium]|nr:MAG: NAD-dependent epimerase/dehydratase family protein [Candidatus Parcubacteria bacterium]
MLNKKQKVLVTGGAGFIGSHLVDALVKEGHKVVVLDSMIGGKKDHINPKVKFYKADIRNLNKIKPLFKGIDCVFHVAAVPRVPVSVKYPEMTHQHNAVGTLNVLIAARDAKVKRLVYSSSSSVYGEQNSLPLHEEMPTRPISPYGHQKLIGEHYSRIFSRLYGLETVMLRYFNVYGPRLDPNGAYAMAIGKFLKQAKENQPLTIFGNGKQSRDFTHVRDVVGANILAMKSKQVGKGEAINIGGGNNHTILAVAKMISPNLKFLPPRLGDPLHTLASIKKAKKLLGWQPEVKLSDGIEELKQIMLS